MESWEDDALGRDAHVGASHVEKLEAEIAPLSLKGRLRLLCRLEPADQIVAIAADCAKHNVRLIEMSVTPTGDWDQFFAWCAEARKQAFEQHRVYVSYVVTAVRTLSLDFKGLPAQKMLDFSLKYGACVAA